MAEDRNNTNAPELNQQELSEQNRIRLEKLNALMEAGQNPYIITTYDVSDHSGAIIANYAEGEEKHVSIAGRIMSRRVMGKASFAHLQDRDGRIQIYVAPRRASARTSYADFKKYDVGDILGVKGYRF